MQVSEGKNRQRKGITNCKLALFENLRSSLFPIYPLTEGHYRVLGKIFTTGIKQPTDMAFDKKGIMYVLDYSLEKIAVYSP